jgi:cytochrome c oxidase subunit 2
MAIGVTRVIERWLPPAASDHAAALDRVLLSVHAHMALIFVLWLALFVIALIKFRSGANPTPRQEGLRGTWPVIAIGLVIVGDIIILATQALPAWAARNEPPPANSLPIEIRVTAEQFAWNIHYPGPDRTFGRTQTALISASNPLGIDRSDAAATDDIGLQNVLMLPVNRTAVIQLTSRDVIHSFTLNEMRVKQDVMPGMTARVWFTPNATGKWEIACSQLCGLGHYRMRGEYQVVEQSAWDQWLTDGNHFSIVSPR